MFIYVTYGFGILFAIVGCFFVGCIAWATVTDRLFQRGEVMRENAQLKEKIRHEQADHEITKQALMSFEEYNRQAVAKLGRAEAEIFLLKASDESAGEQHQNQIVLH